MIWMPKMLQMLFLPDNEQSPLEAGSIWWNPLESKGMPEIGR
jgi:hypothetical protein